MTDRLEEIVMQAHRDYASGLNPRRGLTETIVDALRAAGATVSPEGTRGGEAALPEPPKGPVTSVATARKWLNMPIHRVGSSALNEDQFGQG